jgi:Na+/H+-dicarboxylate symporter
MDPSPISRTQNTFTLAIVVGLLAGVVTGVALHATYLAADHALLHTIEAQQREIREERSQAANPDTRRQLEQQQQELASQHTAAEGARDQKVELFVLLGDLFLRLIQMIIAPLVFTTVVVGVAKLGDSVAVGRIGGKTFAWFLSASLVSLMLGLLMVNLLEPGAALQMPLPDTKAGSVVQHADLLLTQFLHHLIPSSIVEAMAHNNMLGIVIFSVLFGVATAALGTQGAILVQVCEAAAQVILRITGYIMRLSPVAVFGAMTAIIAKQGPGILGTYLVFIGEFYGSLLVLWAVLIVAGFCIIGKRVFVLMQKIKEPILLAFSTSSSEAAFPKTMQALEHFGCKSSIVRFVLPLGYSFNLDGSMMYMTFATLFIAQSYSMDLPLLTQISMLVILMLTSKGVAGVPRASLVVIAGTLATFGIPEAGLALLLGIDPILDMGRSATNVVGNSIATLVVSTWEGGLNPPLDERGLHRSVEFAEPHEQQRKQGGSYP